MILVVGHEKLYVEMQRAYSARGLTVVKIPKSGGVVELDALYRARVRRAQIRAYFYGERVESPRGLPALSGATPGSGPAAAAQANMLVAGEQPGDFTLAPASQVVNFGDLHIWRIGEGAYFAVFCSVDPKLMVTQRRWRRRAHCRSGRRAS